MNECGIDDSKWVPSKGWERLAAISAAGLVVGLLLSIALPPIKALAAGVVIASVVALAAYAVRAYTLERGRLVLRDRLAATNKLERST